MLQYLYCSCPLPAYLKSLAADTQLKLISETDLQKLQDDELLLTFDTQALGLGSVKNNKIHSRLVIDFNSPECQHRKKYGQLASSGLAKAIGAKSSQTFRILDATGGLGHDAFDLTCLGHKVMICERSPVVYYMLCDALERAHAEPQLADLHANLTVLKKNLITDYKHCTTQAPDIVYLDPMFPERKKSALVKKESRWLKEVVGNDVDADQLLAPALELAKLKVVVKRPITAPSLAGLAPHHSIVGKTLRFDVYSKN